jgi:hypothetical protein
VKITVLSLRAVVAALLHSVLQTGWYVGIKPALMHRRDSGTTASSVRTAFTVCRWVEIWIR